MSSRPSASIPASTQQTPGGGDMSEEEGEIVEAKPGPDPTPSTSAAAPPQAQRPPIRISAKPTSTASNGSTRPKVILPLNKGVIGKHLGLAGTTPGDAHPRKKPSSLNALNSKSKPPQQTLTIAGSAKHEEREQQGEADDDKEAPLKPGAGNEEVTTNTLTISIAGISSQVSNTVSKVEGPQEGTTDGSKTPDRPLFRKRHGITRSPGKTKSTIQPNPARVEVSEQDRKAAAELLLETPKEPEAFVAPPVSIDGTLMRIVTPASTSSLPLPLPPHAASPPQRIKPLQTDWSHMETANEGLPYDRDEMAPGENVQARHRYDRTSRDHDRYAHEGRYRDEGRWERDGRRERDDRRSGYDRDDRRSGYSSNSSHHQHSRHRHPHSNSHSSHHTDHYSRANGRGDEDYRPSKKSRKASESPPRRSDQHQRKRSPSRSPMSDDEEETSRAPSRSPKLSQKTILSPRTIERSQRDLEKKSKSRSAIVRDEVRRPGHSNGIADRASGRNRSPPHLSTALPPLNHSLPSKPPVSVGGSISKTSRHVQDLSANEGPTGMQKPPPGQIGGPERLRMDLSMDVASASSGGPLRTDSNAQRPLAPTSDRASEKTGLGPLPPAPPPPAPPQPHYSSTQSHPESGSPRRNSQSQSQGPAAQYPQPPPPLATTTMTDNGYPVPPPAPYHPGNRPTDPNNRKFESPAATASYKPSNETVEALPEDDAYLGVRTGKGAEEVWVDPPSPSLTVAGRTNGAVQATALEGEHQFFGASHISEYTLQQKLGEGTFGVVYKGIRGKEGAVVTDEERAEESRLRTRGLRVKKGDIVALKQIIFHNEGDGLPITSVREIRILKQLDHPNVVPVVDMALDPGDQSNMQVSRTFMVFPYMDHDLAGLLENPQVKLDIGEIKQYSKQLLEGTAYLHRNGILHRDMKAANLLINNKGILMIADFGLARSMEPPGTERDYTSCVVTRWYRPPELLLGERKYHYPVDMWGVGCILLEMFKRSPIFPGNSDLHQAQLIFAACGPPTDETMPGWRLLPGVEGFDKSQQLWKNSGRTVRADASHYDTEIFADLLDKILVLDPKRRLTADEALDHDWFWSEPFPTEPSRMREFMSSHEYDRRKLKESQQAAFVQAVPPVPPPQMVQLRPQPMPPTGFNGMAQQAPMMPYPPVGAFNAPPPNFNPAAGMGMGPSFANNLGAGVGMNSYQQLPPGYAQGYLQGPPHNYSANRPPPSTIQGPSQYNAAYPPPPQAGLDYGRPSQYHQPSGPSWQQSRPGPPAAPNGQAPRVNLAQRLKKSK